MFYNNRDNTYTILGVYHVIRPEFSEVQVQERSFSALAVRLRGESRFSVGNKSYTAKKHSILYIPSGLSYDRTSGSEELVILHLQCHGTDDDGFSLFDAEDAEKLFLELYDIWTAADTAAYNRCMALLYRIFETIEKHTSAQTFSVPESIAPGVEYLYSHYRDPSLTVAELAKLCNFSEVYFRRIYRACFGISPLQDILERRFAYACTLLQTGYYTVKEVAARSGFSDVKYFRTAFSKRYGVTPSAYALYNRTDG